AGTGAVALLAGAAAGGRGPGGDVGVPRSGGGRARSGGRRGVGSPFGGRLGTGRRVGPDGGAGGTHIHPSAVADASVPCGGESGERAERPLVRQGGAGGVGLAPGGAKGGRGGRRAGARALLSLLGRRSQRGP